MRPTICLMHIAMIMIVVGLGTSACSAASITKLTDTSTPAPFIQTFASAQTETPSPSPTAIETLAPTATVTPTQRVAVTSQRATPLPVIPSGVYVTALTIDPLQARSDQAPDFFVTFLNTTGQPQTYRWFIKIYSNQPQSFGETPKLVGEVPVGIAMLQANSQWKTRTFFDCLWFTARVFWIDEENQVHEFSKPNATNLGTGFSVCP